MLIDQFREMLAQKEFHVVVEKGKIWLYFWREKASGNYLDKLPFDDWGSVFEFYGKF